MGVNGSVILPEKGERLSPRIRGNSLMNRYVLTE